METYTSGCPPCHPHTHARVHSHTHSHTVFRPVKTPSPEAQIPASPGTGTYMHRERQTTNCEDKPRTSKRIHTREACAPQGVSLGSWGPFLGAKDEDSTLSSPAPACPFCPTRVSPPSLLCDQASLSTPTRKPTDLWELLETWACPQNMHSSLRRQRWR